jgi:hypothetical protein
VYEARQRGHSTTCFGVTKQKKEGGKGRKEGKKEGRKEGKRTE